MDLWPRTCLPGSCSCGSTGRRPPLTLTLTFRVSFVTRVPYLNPPYPFRVCLWNGGWGGAFLWLLALCLGIDQRVSVGGRGTYEIRGSTHIYVRVLMDKGHFWPSRGRNQRVSSTINNERTKQADGTEPASRVGLRSRGNQLQFHVWRVMRSCKQTEV